MAQITIPTFNTGGSHHELITPMFPDPDPLFVGKKRRSKPHYHKLSNNEIFANVFLLLSIIAPAGLGMGALLFNQNSQTMAGTPQLNGQSSLAFGSSTGSLSVSSAAYNKDTRAWVGQRSNGFDGNIAVIKGLPLRHDSKPRHSNAAKRSAKITNNENSGGGGRALMLVKPDKLGNQIENIAQQQIPSSFECPPSYYSCATIFSTDGTMTPAYVEFIIPFDNYNSPILADNLFNQLGGPTLTADKQQELRSDIDIALDPNQDTNAKIMGGDSETGQKFITFLLKVIGGDFRHVILGDQLNGHEGIQMPASDFKDALNKSAPIRLSLDTDTPTPAPSKSATPPAPTENSSGLGGDGNEPNATPTLGDTPEAFVAPQASPDQNQGIAPETPNTPIEPSTTSVPRYKPVPGLPGENTVLGFLEDAGIVSVGTIVVFALLAGIGLLNYNAMNDTIIEDIIMNIRNILRRKKYVKSANELGRQARKLDDEILASTEFGSPQRTAGLNKVIELQNEAQEYYDLADDR